MKPAIAILLMFLLTQALGLYVGLTLPSIAYTHPEAKEALEITPYEASDPMNAVFFIAYILVGAGVMLLVLRYYKGMALFRFAEFFLIAGSSGIVFFTVLFTLGFRDFVTTFLLAGVLATLLALLKLLRDDAKNLAAVSASAGVGAVFGYSVGFLPSILFIILLSAYDYIAVFKTRHMIELAKGLGGRQLSFSVTAVEKPAKIKAKGKEAIAKEIAEKSERLDLGTGDLAIPVMLSVSAFPLAGLAGSVGVMAGSALALYLILEFVTKKRVFLPALPPLCLGGVLGLLIVLLLKSLLVS